MALIVESVDEQTVQNPAQILSDERIEELLKEAETRLRQQAGLEPNSSRFGQDVETLAPVSQKRIHLPKLQHSLERSSYLKNHDGVTKTDANLMVPKEQRKMADGLRVVAKDSEDNKKVVCHPLRSII